MVFSGKGLKVIPGIQTATRRGDQGKIRPRVQSQDPLLSSQKASSTALQTITCSQMLSKSLENAVLTVLTSRLNYRCAHFKEICGYSFCLMEYIIT